MSISIEAWLVSTGIVALAEVGDKTQLLSLMLAARFRRPGPIILGILLATLANHFLAAALGTWITQTLSPDVLAWILGFSFLAMAAWTLIPDTCDDDGTEPRYGVLLATTIAFFLAEMGDKTQVATIALAARYDALTSVVLGTTLGMMIANVPVVYLGEKLAHRLPVHAIHRVAAVVFALLGGFALSETGASGRQLLSVLAGLPLIRSFEPALLLDSGLTVCTAAVLVGVQAWAFRSGSRPDRLFHPVILAVSAAVLTDVASRVGTGHDIVNLMSYSVLFAGLLGAALLIRQGSGTVELRRVLRLMAAMVTGLAAGAGWSGVAVEMTVVIVIINRLFQPGDRA
ncbi:MAG: TMEM165/GDT1 family protein [Methylococcaceae bacterium]